MSDSGAVAKAAWIKRVLGVSLPGGEPVDWTALRMTWQEASDAADAQIAALQAALRSSDDEELEEIGQFGLSGLTGNFRVPLMAALRELAGGDPAIAAKVAPKLLVVVQKFREHIDSSEKIRACDDNPFGVKLTLRTTIGGALSRMEEALARLR